MTQKSFLLAGLLALGCMSQVVKAEIKNIHGPYLQNITSTEATIMWEADKTSIGWVEVAPDDGTHFYTVERPKYFDCTNGVKNSSKLHAVKLTGLQPGTNYRYRIYSQEILSHEGIFVNYDGHIAASNVYSKKPLTFTTLDPYKSSTTFLVMNDIHGRADIIPTLLEKGNYKEKELIFFNGDMISKLDKSEDFFTGFMDQSINLFAQEKSPYYCRGNHETRGEYATHFQDYFNARIPHLYFSLRQGPIFFIILDTGEDKPDSDIEYCGIVDYDGYRSEQAKWLKTVKDDPDFKTAKYHVVICHMPTTTDKEEWHGNIDCLKKFTPMLNEMNIDIMLCGHNHVDSFQEAGDVIKYPVLVNSNNGVLDVQADAQALKIKTIHNDGKVAFEKTFNCNK